MSNIWRLELLFVHKGTSFKLHTPGSMHLNIVCYSIYMHLSRALKLRRAFVTDVCGDAFVICIHKRLAHIIVETTERKINTLRAHIAQTNIANIIDIVKRVIFARL